MPTDDPPEPQMPGLNIAQDETFIYEGGAITTIFRKDIVGNEQAIAQLCNSHNLSVRGNAKLRARVEELEREKIVKKTFPFANGCFALINVLGVVFIGFGTNYLSRPNPPPYCGFLLWTGVVVALLSALAQPFVPFIVKFITK